MINRPSYAQLTLELTRRSLESLPSTLTPVVSGILVVPATTPATTPETTTATTSVAQRVEPTRWRRKQVRHREMAVR
jgi:hypothetical protein